MRAPKKVLSVFSLVMINVIAVDSLRTLSLSAKLGLPLVFYYVLATFTFFLPIAFVAAELATAYPKTGGLYVWVKEAFGKRMAFVTIWLQWIYNVVWYPTILAFICATLSYTFAPELAHNPAYLLATVVSLFWLFTLVNCFGMKMSSLVSAVGAIIGTILPMLFIIGLAGYWIFEGQPLAVSQPLSFLPNWDAWGNLSLFSAVLFGLIGMEMSAVHAEEVKNPRRDYPLALFYSTLIIISTLILGSLAIVLVIPQADLSVVSGIIDAFVVFFNKYHMPWMINIMAILIILGGLSGMSAWIIGPTKGLLVAAKDGTLPAFLARTNKHGAPVRILVTQAIIVTILSTAFVLLPSINEAYWVLSDLCAQMALLVYVIMFIAAIKLKRTKAYHGRGYQVPGGSPVFFGLAALGIVSCVAVMLIGFVPPTQIPVANVYIFEGILIGGLFLSVWLPWVFSRKTQGKH